MRLQVKGRGIEVSESVRKYAEGKFKRLERQLDDPEIELELHVEANPKIADDHTADAAIRSRRLTLRAHSSARAARRGRSASSTTSTRAARPRTRPPRRSGPPARDRSR